MKTNPNDPINIKKNEGAQSYFNSDGLTKREYFAAMAMQGLYSRGHAIVSGGISLEKKAIDAADSLIAELNKEER